MMLLSQKSVREEVEGSIADDLASQVASRFQTLELKGYLSSILGETSCAAFDLQAQVWGDNTPASEKKSPIPTRARVGEHRRKRGSLLPHLLQLHRQQSIHIALPSSTLGGLYTTVSPVPFTQPKTGDCCRAVIAHVADGNAALILPF